VESVSELVKKYRQAINPPYTAKDLLALAGTILILISIPLTVVLVYQFRGYKTQAVGIRGVAGDLWADVIIGRRDFTDVLSRGYVNPQWVDRPGGVVVDREVSDSTSKLGILYAQSTRESRIIALNLDNCIPAGNTCSAEKVFGQQGHLADYSACNGDSSFQNYPTRAPASAASLCFVKEDSLSTAENLAFIGMYTQGGNLYVPDTENHRILIYHDAWNDQVADEAIGQDNFTGNYCNKTNAWILSTTPSASSLCLVDYSNTGNSGSGVALDPSGNLWVADNGNHRVLRFLKNADGTISKTADVVLGQPNFTTGPGKPGNAINQMANPNSVRFDPSGNLYVSDGGNTRILKFTTDQQTIGGVATVFVGVGGFVSEVDSANSGIWVTNGGHLQLYGFDGILRHDIFTNQLMAGSAGIVKNGNLVAPSPTQGVLLIKDPLTKASGWDRELFDSKTIFNERRMGVGHGVAIAANKLFATDGCRILVWNDLTTLTNGRAADVVLIQPDFNTIDCNMNIVKNLKADASGRVWAKTYKGIYVYDATQAPPILIKTIASVAGGEPQSRFWVGAVWMF